MKHDKITTPNYSMQTKQTNKLIQPTFQTYQSCKFVPRFEKVHG